MAPTPLPFALSLLLIGAAIVGAGLLARRFRPHLPAGLESFVEGRQAAWCAGVASAVILLGTWGTLVGVAVVHDERAYLLQARIFASGRWTAPAPPIPEFFEQMHVFVQPATFAKYPPGHALALVPGIWLGLPGLMPVLLTGLAGALVFWLARRAAGAWVAVLTWLLWSTATVDLFWRASYLSETTSGALWLVALWALLRWLDTSRPGFLVGVSAAIGAGLLTRPLTAAALALPIGVVVLRQAWRAGVWRQLIAPCAAGVLVLAFIPVWNAMTIGDWRIDPYAYYSRVYFPFDVPGFGVDPTPPLRPVPPELQWVGEQFVALHAHHQVEALPAILWERVLALGQWLGDRWRLGLLLLFIAGLLNSTRYERFGLASAAAVLLAHLSFAHPPLWSVYYAEIHPVFFFIVARGAVGLLQCIEHGRLRLGALQAAGNNLGPVTAAAVVLLVVVAVPAAASDVLYMRRGLAAQAAFHRHAAALLASIPEPRAIVFVAYSPRHNYHRGLVQAEVDPAKSHVWVVYDRGPEENRRLREQAPERAVYRLELPRLRLSRIVSSATADHAAIPSASTGESRGGTHAAAGSR